MFRHIAAFEWRYQVRSPVFWVGCLIFFLMAWGATVSDNIQIGNLGSAHKNSPFAILTTVALMGAFSIFVTIAMVANVILRDDETGFAPIIRSTSIGKASYLVGRFTGASAAALPGAGDAAAGHPGRRVHAGQRRPEKIGPLRLGDYAYALFAFALPTLLVTAAAFAIAIATRSMMWTYVAARCARAVFHRPRRRAQQPVLGSHRRGDRPVRRIGDVARHQVLDVRRAQHAAARVLRRAAGQSPALERHRARDLRRRLPGVRLRDALRGRLPPRELASPEREAQGGKLSRAEKAARAHRAELAALKESNPAGAWREVLAADARRALRSRCRRSRPATRLTGRAQLWELAQIDMGYVFRSPAFFVLLAIGVLLAGVNQYFIGEIYGSPSYPVTRA